MCVFAKEYASLLVNIIALIKTFAAGFAIGGWGVSGARTERGTLPGGRGLSRLDNFVLKTVLSHFRTRADLGLKMRIVHRMETVTC